MSCSTSSMYRLMPLARARIAAIPIIPIEPAKAVMNVLPFFVNKLLTERDMAVKKDIFLFLEGLVETSLSSPDIS